MAFRMYIYGLLVAEYVLSARAGIAPLPCPPDAARTGRAIKVPEDDTMLAPPVIIQGGSRREVDHHD